MPRSGRRWKPSQPWALAAPTKSIGASRPWGTSELSYTHFGTDLGLYLGAHVGNLDDLNRAMTTPFTSDSFGYKIAAPNQRVSHDEIVWHSNVGLTKTSRLGDGSPAADPLAEHVLGCSEDR